MNLSSMNTNKKSFSNKINRRVFIGGFTTALGGLTIIPSHVLGRMGRTAPSDKINVAYIGMGTQGLRLLPELLGIPDAQITAICDPQKKAIGYLDWDSSSLLESMRKLINNPRWQTGGNNTIPGGLDNGKELIERYYGLQRNARKFIGCKTYTDFRELFAKETDIDAVRVLTTDHVHGLIADRKSVV